MDPRLFINPQDVWSQWTKPQRRGALRALFEAITCGTSGLEVVPAPTRWISVAWLRTA